MRHSFSFADLVAAILAVPSVRATERALSASDVAAVKSLVAANLSGAPTKRDNAPRFAVSFVRAAVDRFRAGCRYVIVKPDSPTLCAAVNATLAERCTDAPTFRPQSGIETGRTKRHDAAYFADMFARFGCADIGAPTVADFAPRIGADGKPVKPRIDEMRSEFSRRTASLTGEFYTRSGKPPYLRADAATLHGVVIKLTVGADGNVRVPDSAAERTVGGVYALFVDTLAAVADATSAVIAEREAQRAAAAKLREAARAAKRAADPTAQRAAEVRAATVADDAAREAQHVADAATVAAARKRNARADKRHDKRAAK